MSRTVKLKTKPGDILFEFAPDGLYIYVGYRGGARVRRRKAERLHKALAAWLDLKHDP
jgi:hypothetical protein